MYIKKIILPVIISLIFYASILIHTSTTLCAAAPLYQLNTEQYTNADDIFRKLQNNKLFNRQQSKEKFNAAPKTTAAITNILKPTKDAQDLIDIVKQDIAHNLKRKNPDGTKKFKTAAAITKKFNDSVKKITAPESIPNIRDQNNKTLLMLAAQHGYVDIVNQLIQDVQSKNYINAIDSDGNTALRWAMNGPEESILAIATALLNAGAQVDTKDTTKQRTPLHWLLRRHPNAFGKNLPLITDKKTLYDIADLLLKRDAFPFYMDQNTDDQPRNCLYWALFNNDFTLFEKFIKNRISMAQKQKLSFIEAVFNSLQITTYATLVMALIDLQRYLKITGDELLHDFSDSFLIQKYQLTQTESDTLIAALKKTVAQKTSSQDKVTALKKTLDSTERSMQIQKRALEIDSKNVTSVYPEVDLAIKKVQAQLTACLHHI